MSNTRIKCQKAFATGKCWAALDKHDRVVNVISMIATKSTDFERFRTSAHEALQAIGRVVSGEIVQEGEDFYFVRTAAVDVARSRNHITVDLLADPHQFQPGPLPGWRLLGTVTRGDVVGALGVSEASGSHAMIVHGKIEALPAQRVNAALQRKTGTFRVSIDTKADATTFQAGPVAGWEILGTVTDGERTGALGHNLANDAHALILNDQVQLLDKKANRLCPVCQRAKDKARQPKPL